jgi:protein SCO1/2
MKIVDVHITGHEQLEPLGTSADPRPGDLLPPVTLPATGGALTVGAGQGEPTVLTFLFTSCPVDNYCPLLSSKLAALQPLVAGRARIVAVTLDPANDSLEVLKEYGERYGADPEVWRFARLEADGLDALLQQVGGMRAVSPETVTHNLRLVALDAEGRVLAIYPDNAWDPQAVAALFEPPDPR